MAVLNRWCSLLALAPLVVFIALREPDAPPVSSHADVGPSAVEEADETAHLQKPLARSGRASASRAMGSTSPVRFFASKDILTELPKAPSTLPVSLRGIYWMDQHGAYGYSNMPPTKTFDDLTFSFGCSDVTVDPVHHTVRTFTSGMCWTWFNSREAYPVLAGGQHSHSGYTFAFDPSYSKCQVQPFIVQYGITHPLPKTSVSYTMTVLTPKPGDCPPKPGASALERSKCAFARRDTVWYDIVPPFYHKLTYYVFKIGDENHAKTPYFDAYLKFALTTGQPDAAAFKADFGFDLPAGGNRTDTMAVGAIPMN